ncbi:aromatic amino acid aminotransferase I [Cryptococcus neoformans]|nr:aromatic amino acid aminotransferase I [Cryptococcus neoformans var. grubii Bt1]OXH31138.1 aromatic amino acid aminotransferase I [Cryptococcus neoformans var. grubii]
MPSINSTPVPVDFTKYFSKETTSRKRSQLKELRPYFEIPGMISFGVGIPHPSTWPVNGMTLSVPFAGKSVFVPGYNSRSPEDMLPLAPYQEPSKNESLRPDLTEELQYSSTYGTKHLLSWIKEHIERVHAPPYEDWINLLTAGNTDGVDAVMRACFDRGDYMLVEEFAYPGLLSPAATLGIKCLGVPLDSEGVDPSALDEILANWNETERGGPRPKMLVMVPTCSNPAGVTIPAHRKQEIYAICRKWDLLICEDDPYCFLQIRPNGADSPIVPSFLSLDTDGRVIRVDSFSKIVAPGSRLGFVTGHKVLVEKIMNTRESSTQCPSGFSIAAIAAILRAWGGHEGFERKYIPHISDIYSKRCRSIIDLLKKYVPPSTIEIPKPAGGMFLWVRLRIESHPSFPSQDPETISKQVFQAMIDEKVLMAPSEFFKAPSTSVWTPEQEAKRIFVRISFSLPPQDEMEEGAKRMGRALAREWGLEQA